MENRWGVEAKYSNKIIGNDFSIVYVVWGERTTGVHSQKRTSKLGKEGITKDGMLKEGKDPRAARLVITLGFVHSRSQVTLRVD